MSELNASPLNCFLLLCLLGTNRGASGFPLPQLQLSPDDTSEKRDDCDTRFPSISLRDGSLQMKSPPGLRVMPVSQEAWLFDPDTAEDRVGGCGSVKRNLVMADDAAFREQSKLLTSMERQKWLNSYMQKLLVVHSS